MTHDPIVVGLSSVDLRRQRDGGRWAIVGAALFAGGAYLPWITVTGDDRSTVSMHGIEEGGVFFLVGAILVAGLGLWCIVGHPRAAPALLILSGLALGLLALFEFSEVSERLDDSDISNALSSASMGTGIWTLFAGATVTLVAGLALVGRITPASEE